MTKAANLAEFPNLFTFVEFFGAKGDGVTDDTAAIQAALNTGRNVTCDDDRRVYRITNTLVLTATQQTLDLKESSLFLDDPSGLKSHLDVGDNVTGTYASKIRDVVFTRAQAATAGAAIRCRFVGDLRIENCRVFGDSKIFNAVIVSRGIRVNISSCLFQSTISTSIVASGTGPSENQTTDLTVNDCRIEGAGVHGIETSDYTEGLFLRDNIFYNIAGDCVHCDASSDPAGLASFKAYANDLDTANRALFANFCNNWTIADNWISNVAQDGIVVEQCDGVTISGGQMYVGRHAIALGMAGGTYCRNINISSALILGGETGVFFGGANVSYVNIQALLVRSISGYAVNKLAGGDRILIGGLMSANTGLGGISAGGTNVTLGTNALS